jgi:hypothetical protein
MACDIYASGRSCRVSLLLLATSIAFVSFLSLEGDLIAASLAKVKEFGRPYVVSLSLPAHHLSLAVGILKSLEPFLYLRYLNQLQSLEISLNMQFRTISVTASLLALTVAQSLPTCAVRTFS